MNRKIYVIDLLSVQLQHGFTLPPRPVSCLISKIFCGMSQIIHSSITITTRFLRPECIRNIAVFYLPSLSTRIRRRNPCVESSVDKLWPAWLSLTVIVRTWIRNCWCFPSFLTRTYKKRRQGRYDKTRIYQRCLQLKESLYWFTPLPWYDYILSLVSFWTTVVWFTYLSSRPATLWTEATVRNGAFRLVCRLNGWQLAKMKKSIPDISLPWSL